MNLAPNQLDTDDSDLLNGINDRKFSFMFVASYTHPFDFATVSFSYETDISNKYQGQRAVAGLQRTFFAHAQRKWIINLGLELEYSSAGYANYYFGVDLDERNDSVYSQYQVDSVVQPSLTLGGYYQISKQWNLVANLRWQSLPDDVKTVQLLTAVVWSMDFSDYSTLSKFW